MIRTELNFELSNLSRSLRLYGELSGKTEDEVITKQSGKLAWNIYAGLRSLAPGKGAVRAERMASLKAGYGVKVRKAVLEEVMARYQATVSLASGKTYLAQRRGRRVVAMSTMVEDPKTGKRLNLQALAVERELNVRERARGFASISTPRPVRSYEQVLASTDYERLIDSRYGFVLSVFNVELRRDPRTKHAELKWLGRKNDSYQDAVLGLSKPKQQQVLIEAVKKTDADIGEYIRRKQRENIDQAGLN